MALSKIDIENMVTGEVNVANGGTGLSSGTSGQFLIQLQNYQQNLK